MVIVLNGASSSGKTSLCHTLQAQWPQPLLHAGTDTMIAMMPASYLPNGAQATEGVEFVTDEDELGPLVRARRGAVARAIEKSFAFALGALARNGHDLVVDLVLYDPESLPAYVRAFQGLRTYFIGVRCDLPTLEARERARGDRVRGLTRSQHLIVHQFSDHYDFEVDTTSAPTDSLALSIIEHVDGNPAPRSFVELGAGSREPGGRR